MACNKTISILPSALKRAFDASRKREGGAPSLLLFQYPVREAVRERGC